MVHTLPAKLRFLWSIIPPPLTGRLSSCWKRSSC